MASAPTPTMQAYVCAWVHAVASDVSDYASLWMLACQRHLSMGFSRHEYWSVLP